MARGVQITDLPKHIRDQVISGSTHRDEGRKTGNRTKTRERTIGRCIPADGTTCYWTGHYGAAWERHVKETGHGRLELIDTEEG